MAESRESRQDAALVTLLNALPPDRLTRVLVGVGIEPDKADAVSSKPDARRCQVCGHGYVRCREIDSKSPDDHHAWSPDRNRAGVPTPPPESEPAQ